MRQVVRRHLIRRGDGAVVRVVEEQPISAAAMPVFPHPADKFVVAPLVHDHEVGAVKGFVEVERVQVVRGARDRRVRELEHLDRPFAVLAAEVHEAPRVARLVNADVVAALAERAHDSAEEVGVAVVPAGQERVIEHHDAHALGLSSGVWVSGVERSQSADVSSRYVSTYAAAIRSVV